MTDEERHVTAKLRQHFDGADVAVQDVSGAWARLICCWAMGRRHASGLRDSAVLTMAAFARDAMGSAALCGY